MTDLTGKKIAFLVAEDGVEQVELTSPWEAVKAAGATPVLVAPKSGQIQARNHLDRGDKFGVDKSLDQADAFEFDALMLPGGRGKSRSAAPDSQSSLVHESIFRPGQAGCRDLPCPMDADRSRGDEGPDPDLLAKPSHRPHQLGRQLG